MKKLITLIVMLITLINLNAQVDSTITMFKQTVVKSIFDGNHEYIYVNDTLISHRVYNTDSILHYNRYDSLLFYEVVQDNYLYCYNSDNELLWYYIDYFADNTDITTTINYTNYNDFNLFGYRSDVNVVTIKADVVMDRIEVFSLSGELLIDTNVNSDSYRFKTTYPMVIVKAYSDSYITSKKL